MVGMKSKALKTRTLAGKHYFLRLTFVMKNISPLHSRMPLSKLCLLLKSEGAASEGAASERTRSKPFLKASSSLSGSKSERYAFRVQQILSPTLKTSLFLWSLYWEVIAHHQNPLSLHFILLRYELHSELIQNDVYTSCHYFHSPNVKKSSCHNCHLFILRSCHLLTWPRWTLSVRNVVVTSLTHPCSKPKALFFSCKFTLSPHSAMSGTRTFPYFHF